MKIKVNIPGFGERYCSDNVEYKIYSNEYSDYKDPLERPTIYYIFYKKNKKIKHNEYGPSIEYKDGIYIYYLNNKLHRVDGPAYYDTNNKK